MTASRQEKKTETQGKGDSCYEPAESNINERDKLSKKKEGRGLVNIKEPVLIIFGFNICYLLYSISTCPVVT